MVTPDPPRNIRNAAATPQRNRAVAKPLVIFNSLYYQVKLVYYLYYFFRRLKGLFHLNGTGLP